MPSDDKTVELAGAVINCRCHACAFFKSKDDEYAIMLPFLKAGLDRGDRAIHLIDPQTRSEHRERMARFGIDAGAAEDADKLETRVWENAYVTGGRFDLNATLALLLDICERGAATGTGVTRAWANMEWAAPDLPGVEDLAEYERRINEVAPDYDICCVCTYDLSRFPAPVIMDVLRTHPMVLVGDSLHENPFYIPPDAFLRDLQARRPAG